MKNKLMFVIFLMLLLVMSRYLEHVVYYYLHRNIPNTSYAEEGRISAITLTFTDFLHCAFILFFYDFICYGSYINDNNLKQWAVSSFWILHYLKATFITSKSLISKTTSKNSVKIDSILEISVFEESN